jgi:tetratricopeptide (TPR) repeat protein
MKTAGRIIASALMILLGAHSFAQETRPPQLLQPRALSLYCPSRAAISFLEPRLQTAEHDLRGAIAAFQLAIDLWTRSNGPHYFVTGAAYSLRGQVLEYMGEHHQAIADYQNALSLFEETLGKDSPAYLRVQCAYAHALRNAGSIQQAARLEKEEKIALANVRIQQCNGYTMTAESFR